MLHLNAAQVTNTVLWLIQPHEVVFTIKFLTSNTVWQTTLLTFKNWKNKSFTLRNFTLILYLYSPPYILDQKMEKWYWRAEIWWTGHIFRWHPRGRFFSSCLVRSVCTWLWGRHLLPAWCAPSPTPATVCRHHHHPRLAKLDVRLSKHWFRITDTRF